MNKISPICTVWLRKFFCYIALAFFYLMTWQFQAYGAKEGGPERIRSCTSIDKQPYVGPFDLMLKTEANGYTYIGKEMDFSPTNEFCLGQFIAIYGTVKLAIAGINLACGTGSPVPRPFPTPVSDAMDLAKATKKAITTADTRCKAGLVAGMSPIVTAFAQLGITYEVAKQEYENVRVCGSDMVMPDPNQFMLSSRIQSSYSYYLEDYNNKKISEKNDPNYNYNESKEYREYLHGGKEFEDNPSEGDYCRDPSRGNSPQRYYMRGTKPGIFLCEKYNPKMLSDANKSRVEEYKIAYDCCIRRSRNFICLEKTSAYSNLAIWNKSDHIYCKSNSKCSFNNNKAIIYETYRRDNNRLICARSYSLCPFNFSVGGGTIYPDYFKDGVGSGDSFVRYRPNENSNASSSNPTPCDGKSEIRNPDCSINNKANKLKNYCQYYRHCTVVNPFPHEANFDNLSPYFSKACINFIGDSQNGVDNGLSFNPGLSLGHQSNFSAPIVQCIKETMENIFNNRAGHSRCTDGSFGDLASVCKDENGQDAYTVTADNFTYRKGNKVKKQSLFETLQSRLKNVITLVLVISVVFLGVKILMLKVDIQNKKEILTYIVKIGFVIYFVNGNAWKGIFFDGIYNGSNEIAKIFFKINSVDTANDKCNFGAMYNENGGAIFTPVKYPDGKSYLMIWDTLDCKIMQYLNYGPGFSATTIFLLIVASFFTGGIGLMLAMGIFIFAFSLIALTIRAIHIFVSSAVAIIIYVFVSPIIIPLILFERTKSIFDAWLSHLMSFTLQPIILFSYLAIFITLSEKIMYDNAVMENNKLICKQHCRSKAGILVEFDISKCRSELFGDVIDPYDTSVACILNFNDYGSSDSGFMSFFGITGLKSINNLLKGNSTGSVDASNRRIMLVLKSALFLYILLQFADEISGITSRLIGENIDIKAADGFAMLKKFTEGVRSIQIRSARFIDMQAKGGSNKIQNIASTERSSPISTSTDRGEAKSEGFANKE